MAACLAACVMDPQGDSQSPVVSQAPDGNQTSEDTGAVAFRVALPESAIGRVDSAELRMRRPDGTEQAWRMTIGDSVLQADLAGLEPGPAEIDVFAYTERSLAYYGSAIVDPAETGRVEFSVTLGRVGQVRIEGRFAEGLE